jgi:MazG family protein
MPDVFDQAGAQFKTLVEIMHRLRGPDGCPWDRKQSLDSLRAYLLEETYEVLDAIDRRNWADLAEELGDLMLQPVFQAELAAEDGHFTIADCIEHINQKLIRRHPHIFGDTEAATAEEVKVRWDEIKRREKAAKGETEAHRRLDGVVRAQPALAEAAQITSRAAAAGFDWPNVEGALEKLREELSELAAARTSRNASELEHELGDVLFTVVNIARFLKVDPEQALRNTNRRFRDRFGFIEKRLSERGAAMEDTSLEDLESLWQEAKRNELSARL